jgi:hypothetical protein
MKRVSGLRRAVHSAPREKDGCAGVLHLDPNDSQMASIASAAG